MDLIEHNKKQEEALRQMRLVLGQNIRAKREALGYSQEKLAFLAALMPMVISLRPGSSVRIKGLRK